MTMGARPRIKFYGLNNFHEIKQLDQLSPGYRRAMRAVAYVLPFRTNHFVINELIDWDRVPEDPIFQLTFPQPEMLNPSHLQRMFSVLEREESPATVRATADEIRRELNPHPAGQLAYNVPTFQDEPVPGVQHKYSQTCLVFPSAGQTCHAYCSFCFRWPQFVGMPEQKFATDEGMRYAAYIRHHREITDVLITGGDPLVMRADVLARYIEPLLAPEFDHVRTIRIGTKTLTYWPYRYLSDDDTTALLKLFERIVQSGKHLAIMAHFNHFAELAPRPVQDAIGKVRATGAVIRTQSPLVRHINDDSDVWSRLWQEQVRLGCIPYYMFVERDTGANCYFKVPLYRAVEIYRQAVSSCSGLARTVRGPSMSTLPGKVVVDGVTEIAGQLLFVLSFLQARQPEWCKRPFFAEFDPMACWLSELRPAFGEKEFFYEAELREMLKASPAAPSTATRQELTLV